MKAVSPFYYGGSRVSEKILKYNEHKKRYLYPVQFLDLKNELNEVYFLLVYIAYELWTLAFQSYGFL